MSKVMVDRELLEYLAEMGDEAIQRMGSYLAEKHGEQRYVDAARAILAQPAEAEGVELYGVALDYSAAFGSCEPRVVAADYASRIDDPKCTRVNLVRQSDHLAALSAVTAERDRLMKELGQAHRATNSECMDWAREYERRKEVQVERDQLRAEVNGLRGLLRDATAVAITMLYDSHRDDVLEEFTAPELEAVVKVSAHLQSAKVEHVYRLAWDAALAAKEA